jgi:phosphatidylserine/phosphatidylglycerophosphate/cardiolipin synthase-like enzyme
MSQRLSWPVVVSFAILLTVCNAPAAQAAERLCDTSFQDCRAPLLTLIAAERARIDVAFDMMEDDVIADALIRRFKGGLPVRVLMDPRRNAVSARNAAVLRKLAAAGIPMRGKTSGSTLHWKFMLFPGQETLEVSAANFSDYYFIPVTPYVNYTDEAVFFTSEPALVDSFKTRMDDAWVATAGITNYANVTGTLLREYGRFAISPELLFVPWQNFAKRAVPLYDAERTRIDVIMYKITEPSHADGLIRAAKRGVPVRLLVEPSWYRSTANVWQAYNVDRLYASGVQIRVRAHQGFTHEKIALLYGQIMSIFGSSNWTIESNSSQHEHNIFTKKDWIFAWFKANFERKWKNSTGKAETKAFVPLAPDKPVYTTPANLAAGQPSTGVYLTWKPGPWAHKADVYFGTTATPPLLAANVSVSPNTTKKYALPALTAGRTYYWKIVSKTMANQKASGPVWSFSAR